MALKLGDPVFVTADGFLATEGQAIQRTTEAYIIRPQVYRGRNHAWIAVTSQIPLHGLWSAYPIKLYYPAGKEPIADGKQYVGYDFSDEQLFYLVPVMNLRKLSQLGIEKPRLTQEEITQYDNKLEVAKKFNMKKLKYSRYINALSRYMDALQGIPNPLIPQAVANAQALAPAPAPAPAAAVVNLEEPQAPQANANEEPIAPAQGNQVNEGNNNPQGGAKRKRRFTKRRSSYKNKMSRKY